MKQNFVMIEGNNFKAVTDTGEQDTALAILYTRYRRQWSSPETVATRRLGGDGARKSTRLYESWRE